MSAAPSLSPRELLERVVRPNFLALQASRASFQHAYNTVLSADALVAHVYFTQSHQRHPKHDDGYREKLANERPDGLPHIAAPGIRLESGRYWSASALTGAQRRAEQTPTARPSRARAGDSRGRNAV